MMFLKSALTLFLATNASAFFVSPGPRHFVSRHVALSDPTTSSEVQPEGEDKVSMEVAAPEDAESANNGKRVFQGERHTIYVGNLPYGMLALSRWALLYCRRPLVSDEAVFLISNVPISLFQELQRKKSKTCLPNIVR